MLKSDADGHGRPLWQTHFQKKINDCHAASIWDSKGAFDIEKLIKVGADQAMELTVLKLRKWIWISVCAAQWKIH